ncbi:hypothetical protein [Bradyrhizobium sp. CCBAU 53421]|uniref:hypothetical protein n=1 Tax=Bradyrhizobium sp. CCBAU 53421 TaxID=1325120 RepID=UPI00188AB358|nr:hypothetical protein [Bradyrhizobium sp. CCBAU 53421]
MTNESVSAARPAKRKRRPLAGTAEATHAVLELLLVFAVVLGVMPARFGVVMLGVAGMAMGAVGVVRRLLVIALFVVLGRFAVMTRRVLVMFGRLVMMLNACVVAHDDLQVWRMKSTILMQQR